MKIRLKSAIAPTILAGILFFLNYFAFGAENTMIAPFAVLAFLRFRTISNHYECMLKTWAIFLLMAAAAFLAAVNLPSCIIVNAAALFWLAYRLIDEYNPTNYFPYGMALIFFQISPESTVKGLGIRLLAITVSLGVIFLFVLLLSVRKKDKNPICSYIREGLTVCGALLYAYLENHTTDSDALHQELCSLNKKISGEIHTYNRASVRLAGKINWYCRYVVLFQVINYYTTQPYEEETFLRVCSIYNRFFCLFENRKPTADYHRLDFRNAAPTVHAFRFRFALRLVCIVTPCMVFAYLAPLANAYWLVISVFFMMIPVYENTKSRIRQRMTGTFFGILLCFVLFSIFQAFPGRSAVMMIANFFIYASSSYSVTVAFITCSALAISTIDTVVSVVLLQRIFYTAAGALIAFLGNKFVFPIHTAVEMKHLMERLDDIRENLVSVDEQTFSCEDERYHRIDELIIKAYLLMKRLQTYYDSLPEPEKTDAFLQYERDYMLFMGGFLMDHLVEKSQS